VVTVASLITYMCSKFHLLVLSGLSLTAILGDLCQNFTHFRAEKSLLLYYLHLYFHVWSLLILVLLCWQSSHLKLVWWRHVNRNKLYISAVFPIFSGMEEPLR